MRKKTIPIEETKDHGLRYVLSTHFFTLLGANLLCFLFCLPIVTIPASLCGFHAVIQQYYRKGYGDVFPTFIREFKADFLPRLGLSLLLALIPGLGWWLGSLVSSNGSWVGLCLTLVLTLSVFSWFYPQLALLKLPPKTALRNAFLLTMIEAKKDLLLLLITVLCFAPIFLLLPYSLFLCFCIYPLLPMLLRTAVTDPVLSARLIREEAEELSSAHEETEKESES